MLCFPQISIPHKGYNLRGFCTNCENQLQGSFSEATAVIPLVAVCEESYFELIVCRSQVFNSPIKSWPTNYSVNIVWLKRHLYLELSHNVDVDVDAQHGQVSST